MQLIITEGVLKCPQCYSDDVLRINNIELNIENNSVIIPCYCENCQSEWEDVYEYSETVLHY